MKRKQKICIFVAGTDTGAGKTVITGLLAKSFADSGYSVCTQKWVETGVKGGISSDIMSHIRTMGCARLFYEKYADDMSPFLFKFASSPHLAARREGKKVKIGRIISAFKRLRREFDVVIVEGAGGLMVPLDGRYTAMDVCKSLDLPVVLVAANRLGGINHTLLSYAALENMKIKILGLIFNQPGPHVNQLIARDNPRIVKKLIKASVFGSLPRCENKKKLEKVFYSIGRKVVRSARKVCVI
ncbi:MAG TPA: dethiobiotin synthase [Candidatus Omnitrophota bacterium]|nr:dethiobiotin synthase [Candidatus Omnitrophota bacterium]HPS20442.1 dethiobiotin synthase [Candidatus Omnitrophota bacterium]